MADKLIYKGGVDVVDHAGTEIQLVRPRKGTYHKFPRWWNKKGTVAYIDCAIFKVSLSTGAVVRLIVPSNIGVMPLEIRHDGEGNFIFPVKGSIERIAVFHETDNTLYKEYQFSKISGGAVLTRTVNSYPVVETPAVVEEVVEEVEEVVSEDTTPYTATHLEKDL